MQKMPRPTKWNPENLVRFFRAGEPYAGFLLLVTAIRVESQNPDMLHQATEEIYKIVADTYNETAVHKTDALRVKKNMRTQIQACWKKGGKQAWLQLFEVDEDTPPDTLEFIDSLAGFLKRKKEG